MYMHVLTLLMIVVVTTFEFFAKGDKWGRGAFLPGSAGYLAELLGAVALFYVVIAGARTRFRFVRPIYWMVFGGLVVTIIAGVLVNRVEPGPVFAGIRIYLRAIPWFLVPAVVAFTDGQVIKQLRLLVLIALIQVPFAIEQRMMTASTGRYTGDWTGGTLMLSPTLTIFLVCSLCMAAAFLVRKQIKPWQFALLFVLLLVPVMINETKVTIVLLPVGLLVAFLTASRPEQRVRYVVLASSLIAVSGAIFVPVYDRMAEDREYAVPLTEFLGDPDRLNRYMSTTDDVGIGDRKALRLDSIIVPLRRLSRDPAQLMFGLGIGNASNSALGHGFTGQHFRLYGPFMVTSFGRFVLELGLLGLAAVFALMWLIFRDACALARRNEGVKGALGAGWAGVTVVIAICIVYTDLVIITSLSFLFWYFSGLIAAEHMRTATARSSSKGARPKWNVMDGVRHGSS